MLPSSLNYSASHPSSGPMDCERTRGVLPSPNEMFGVASVTGRKSRYRSMTPPGIPKTRSLRARRRGTEPAQNFSAAPSVDAIVALHPQQVGQGNDDVQRLDAGDGHLNVSFPGRVRHYDEVCNAAIEVHVLLDH